MGGKCSNHAYKLIYRTNPSQQDASADVYYQGFKYKCINCGKEYCNFVHLVYVDSVTSYVFISEIKNIPSSILLQWMDDWIPVAEGWIQ